MNKKQIMLKTIFWGFILWLFGYILGIILFGFVSKELIGFFIMPLGVTFTLWVLLKKFSGEEFMYYMSLGIIWTIMAIALDYLFIVELFKSSNYYKLDVYVYYIVTLILPIAVWWYKKSKS